MWVGLLAGALCFDRGLRLVSAAMWIVIGTVILLQQHRRYRSWQRAVRIDRGLCPNCAYDLRENSDRCPECGRPVPYSILLGRKITLKRRSRQITLD